MNPPSPLKVFGVDFTQPPFSFNPRFPGAVNSAGGSVKDIKLTQIFAKKLYATDVSKEHSRVTMPRSKVLVQDFLTKEEELHLKLRDENGHPLKIKVKVIGPCCSVYNLDLARWSYADSRSKGKQSKRWKNAVRSKRKRSKRGKNEERKEPGFSYAISGAEWKTLMRINSLGKGNRIQVWSFRGVNGELGLVIVDEGKDADSVADAVVVHDDADRELSWGRKRRRS